MFKKAIIAIFIALVISQSYSLADQKDDKSELMNFIKTHNYEDVISNEDIDEEFQILIRVAPNKDLNKLRKLISSKSTKTDEKVLAIRALGSIKDFESNDYIKEALLNEKEKDIIFISTWALIQIGGDANYNFLVEHSKRINALIDDDELVFKLLMDLNQKYKNASALQYSVDFIKDAPKEQKKAIFLFTVFGRSLSSENTLFNLLNSTNKDIRLTSTKILGEFYASPNAVKPFETLLTKEKDIEIRNAIIKGLRIIGCNSSEKLLNDIINKPLNKEEQMYAQSELKKLEKQKKDVEKEAKKPFKINKYKFRKELTKLIKSKGNFGSYELLAKNARFEDIFLLDNLREAIMLRASDSAINDYNTVTKIITDIRIKQHCI